MIKKTIQYTNLDGAVVSEDFYFAMSLNETLQEAADGSFVEKAQVLAKGGASNVEIYKNFAYILEKAIGRRSPDGSYLMNSPEITLAFMNSDAFSVLLFELLNNADQAVEFFTQIFPKDLAEKINELNGQQALPFSEVQLPAQPTERDPNSYSHEELVSMPAEQFDKLFGKNPQHWNQTVMKAAYMRKISEKENTTAQSYGSTTPHSHDEEKDMNSLKDLIAFFGCEGRPVTPGEFRDFWNSCTDADKEYYKNAPIQK